MEAASHTETIITTYNMKFKLLTVMSITITVFWDVTPCMVVQEYQCFLTSRVIQKLVFWVLHDIT
jgi:hypothetical protein